MVKLTEYTGLFMGTIVKNGEYDEKQSTTISSSCPPKKLIYTQPTSTSKYKGNFFYISSALNQ